MNYDYYNIIYNILSTMSGSGSSMDIKKIIDIAQFAGQIILQIYYDNKFSIIQKNKESNNNFEVEYKSDNSPLTIADKKANQYICNEIKKLYPNIPIISEENKNAEYITRQKYEYCWLIDPLDGTKEFIKRNGEFTVNIGLIHYGVPVLGVVHIPVEADTYFAVRNKGAFRIYNNKITSLNEIRKDNEAIRMQNNNDNNQKKIIFIGSRSHLNQETKTFIHNTINIYNKFIGNQNQNQNQNTNNYEFISVGSSIKLIWIATGKADIYPRIAPTMEWDTCAADIILRESGGTIAIHNDYNNKLTYNKQNLLNPSFICFKNKYLASIIKNNLQNNNHTYNDDIHDDDDDNHNDDDDYQIDKNDIIL